MCAFRKRKHSRLLREFLETVVMTVIVFAFLVTFIVQGYKVYGTCMEPYLYTGERLLGNKFVYRFDQPDRGDVIVFKYPVDPSKTFIKRVIALPGETIEIREGQVYIDGQPLKEDYVSSLPPTELPRHKISQGSLFVLGDNRDQSNDSRTWGDLPIRNVQAKAWVRYWPLSRAAIFH